ncbi:MAG: hypothetical protein OES57_08725 [Acidimicrobiia bacterium]|nr:hypothetical protein [Acidimicrobiia bacterium]
MTWLGRISIVAALAAFAALMAVTPASTESRIGDTAEGGVFYGTELIDPERNAFLAVIGEDNGVGAASMWVDYKTSVCGDNPRRPIATIGFGPFVRRANGVETISSEYFRRSRCVNNEQQTFDQFDIEFRYDPNTDTLKVTQANGGPITMQRICDGSGNGGKGKNAFRNVFTGTPQRDQILGTAARDLIDARGGNDVIRAGSGNDIICVGAGNDVVRAGKGFDILIGDNGVEVLRGGLGQDVLLGWFDGDTLRGEEGNDVLFGVGAGDARLDGGPGNDYLLLDEGFANGGPGPSDECRLNVLTGSHANCEILDLFEF